MLIINSIFCNQQFCSVGGRAFIKCGTSNSESRLAIYLYILNKPFLNKTLYFGSCDELYMYLQDNMNIIKGIDSWTLIQDSCLYNSTTEILTNIFFICPNLL